MDDFYMATDGKGGFWFREVEHQGFNSRRDLFGAFERCASGQAMTREEEYANMNAGVQYSVPAGNTRRISRSS
ncbi:hypothetical protein [Thiocystis violascens]|nr:hypothetical protein [Thiocystis violascens]